MRWRSSHGACPKAHRAGSRLRRAGQRRGRHGCGHAKRTLRFPSTRCSCAPSAATSASTRPAAGGSTTIPTVSHCSTRCGIRGCRREAPGRGWGMRRCCRVRFVPGAAVPEYAARHASRRCGHRRRRGQGPARLDSPVRLHLGRRTRVREAAQATSPHQMDQDRSLRIARPLRPGRRGLPMALRRTRTAVERFGRCRLPALEGDARGLPDHECPKCRPLCRLGPLNFGGRPMARGAGRGRGRGSR